MRKIISVLTILALVASGSASVVSCSVRMSNIELSFQWKDKPSNYDQQDVFNAFNGTTLTPYFRPPVKNKGGGFALTKNLAQELLNLFGFNQSLVTTADKISTYRKAFIGTDPVPTTPKPNYNIPSVDGLFYGKVQEETQAEFYKRYQNTKISSLTGLYELYKYVEDGGNVNDLGAGAKASYDEIKNVFSGSNKDDAENFFVSFLNQNKKNFDSAWTSWAYKNETVTQLDSEILSYDVEKKEKIDDYRFTPDEQKKYLGTTAAFSEINTALKDVKDNPAKIGNDRQNPFDLLIFPTVDDLIAPGKNTKFQFDEGWNPKSDDSELDPQKTWEVKIAKLDNQANIWNLRTTNADFCNPDNQDGSPGTVLSHGFLQTNVSVAVPLKPLPIQLTYSTNVRKNDSQKYLLSFTLNNLTALFTPRTIISQFRGGEDGEKDQETIGNRYVKWQFTHYQFSDQNDLTTPAGLKNKTQPGNGYFSNLFLSDLKITKLGVDNK